MTLWPTHAHEQAAPRLIVTMSREIGGLFTQFGDREGDDDDDDDNDDEPYRMQILDYIKSSPENTVRPADLSQQLGLSINDASAELCFLLRIVGKGASFHFEDVNVSGGSGVVKSMVFKFPADFDHKALRAQRQDEWNNTFIKISKISIKAVKVVTAFGLIISTIIISVAVLVALISIIVAAFVSFSRGGDSRVVSRKLRNLIVTIRQLLLCYALFAPTDPTDDDTGQHNNNFFREAAYDTWLVLSLCCGNPGSVFFWFRTNNMRHRSHRRGWRDITLSNPFLNDTESEGVNLLNRNTPVDEERSMRSPTHNNARQSQQQQTQGLLPSLVEFLFGPTMPSATTQSDRWRLRSAVIVLKATNDISGSGSARPISLQDLAPFVDSPPSSMDDAVQIVSEGLSVVAYFNGVPCSSSTDGQEQKDESKALFQFPELLSESYLDVRYDDPLMWERSVDGTNQSLKDFFYNSVNPSVDFSARLQVSSNTTIPKYLYEQRKIFSTLSRNHFLCCLLVATLNFFGVIWFNHSLESGILKQNLGRFGSVLKVGFIPVLWFYARLFVIIPISRLVYLGACNELCKRRNQKRKQLALELKNRDDQL
jgi:hypothetical protein